MNRGQPLDLRDGGVERQLWAGPLNTGKWVVRA